MSDPTVRCNVCGRVVTVDLYARGFPPEAAIRRLIKACKAEGHKAEPVYRAGITPFLAGNQ